MKKLFKMEKKTMFEDFVMQLRMELKTKMDNFRGFILGFWEAVVKAN